MKVSGPRKHHYGPCFFLAPEIVKMRLFLAPEIVNMTKITFMGQPPVLDVLPPYKLIFESETITITLNQHSILHFIAYHFDIDLPENVTLFNGHGQQFFPSPTGVKMSSSDIRVHDGEDNSVGPQASNLQGNLGKKLRKYQSQLG